MVDAVRGRVAVCHVLIIEDEALIALDLQDLLEAHGATSISIAETQADAVEAARTRRPDVITSDVTLREGTGPKAVEAILAELGQLPVIFITASPEACIPCPPPARIMEKPLRHGAIVSAFRELAPHC